MEHPLLVSRGNKPRRGRVVKCGYCHKEIYVRPSMLRSQNYCSLQCHNNAQTKGKTLYCKVCGKLYYRSPAQIKWRGTNFCSNRCKWDFYRTLKGEKSIWWQGGKSSIYRRLRSSAVFVEWRRAVFERDNYTCQRCGARSQKNKGVKLHPHHIKSFTNFPELRFDVDNGQTLCEKCHKREHSNENSAG